MEKKKVKVSNEELVKEARNLMIKSGYKVKARTEKRKDYINKGIRYELKTGSALVEEIKDVLPDKWARWVQQTHAYLCSGKDRMKRLTIDRRDSNNNYSLDNIDFLPFGEHVMKDRAIEVTVYDLQRQSFNQYVTMTEASKVLKCSTETVSTYCGSGVLYKNRYLFQSEGEKVGQSNNKKERNQKVLAVSTLLIYEIDDDGNAIRTFPVQAEGEISFPKLEIRRHVI